MAIFTPAQRIRHLHYDMLANSDFSHLEPPKVEVPLYYANVDWQSIKRLNARAGVGSKLFDNRIAPPLHKVVEVPLFKQWQRDWLDEEDEYQISHGNNPKQYPSFL